jgi:hypothetical protein
MRVAIFLVFWCILLLRGDESLSTRTYQYDDCYTLSGQPGNKYPAHNISSGQDCPVVSGHKPEMDQEYLFADDVEDEDTSSGFARKYRLLARYGLTYTTSVLRCLLRYYKGSPFFSGEASYKYLLQGVLRI